MSKRDHHSERKPGLKPLRFLAEACVSEPSIYSLGGFPSKCLLSSFKKLQFELAEILFSESKV